jgi:hypothetical protein
MKPIPAHDSETVVPFTLGRQGIDPKTEDDATGEIKGEVRIDLRGITIRIDGYGDAATMNGYGSPILIEHYNGELVIRLWADINQEDPTHAIDLEGAKESMREERK